MVVNTRKDRPVILGVLIVTFIGLGILIKHLSTDTPLDTFWIIVLVLFIYETCIITVDLFLSLFKSPLWIELNDKTVTIKMFLRKPYSRDVDMIDSVQRRNFFLIGAFHNWSIIFIDKKNTLYFRKQKLEHLDEFLRELKKVNPKCRIDETLS